MGRSAVRKIKRRAKRKPYTFNLNAINNRKKHRKQRAVVAEKAMEEEWDSKATTKANLARMGVAYDPNEALPVPATRDTLGPPAHTPSQSRIKTEVLGSLEAEARRPRPSEPRVSLPEVHFAVRMMERHGEDFKAMARDPLNEYQDTPAQLRRKIAFFKTTRQYRAYLTAKDNVAKAVKKESVKTES